MKTTYLVTKLFISGNLEGLVITERLGFKPEKLRVDNPCCGSSGYVITKVEEVQS